MISSLKPSGKFPKLIAFHLPQFHPTPENDEWWGKGFTEWTNVTKAKPLFDGHYQPHLPADLGFYDLRLKETRHEQIKLARQYGIDGFCYHYYWFSGKRILNKPVDDMFEDKESDMPFCFCWANENWTRKWDAAEHEILIAQRYLPEDPLNFIREMIKFFKDPRYIRIDGAPFLIVYRPQHLPDPSGILSLWRKYCRDEGIERIHLCAALTHGNDDYAGYGFDSGVQFPPHQPQIPTLNDRVRFKKPHLGAIFDYRDLIRAYLERKYSQPNIFLTVSPSWDNTARTNDRSLILINSSPSNYEYWLACAIHKTCRNFPEQERIVFINAWNEWAEGCHLEPDSLYGHQFLEATRNAKNNPFSERYLEEIIPPSHFSFRHFLSDMKSFFSGHCYSLFSLFRRRMSGHPAFYSLLRKLRKWMGI